ncbi:retrovirus-related pol polyprotein from transposon TNT 1-94 [Tanacetum coccineum]|uniref:Retrovirus-related pol polyprotein from transposon TNT 1-94 n=1 Tax=Tanacetum coccineum TaxID=301880 RepID=A0ABQ4ZR32_9ASTR
MVESLESYYSLSTENMKERVRKSVSCYKSSSECPVLTSTTTRMAKNEVNEIRAERLARTANPLALVAQQQLVYHHQNHPTQNTQYSSTRSQQSTRNRGKAIVTSSAPTYDPEPATVTEDDEMSKEKEIDKLISLISLSGTGYDNQRAVNVAGARENVAYHKENMLLCKQEEAGVQLNAEQADWKDDTDDEFEDRELEAHYMYMAQIQEVTPDPVDNSGPIFDDEPMHKDNQDDTDDLDQERNLLASLIQKLKCEIDDSKNRNKFLESSNKALVDKLKGEIEDFKTKNKSLESSNNHFKEANNELSKTNQLMFKDLKKFQAELDKYNDVNYVSKVEIDCAKAKGDLMSYTQYKIDFEKSSNAYTRQINDLNQTISDMKKELCAHQETISIMSQAKEAQIKLYKTREDKELDKVIALENKVKVLDDIVYKTGQSVQTMNMLNRNCKTSFAKPEFLKKAQRANPRLYDIGCYNDNLALMLAPESDETIRLDKESRSKLSDLIRPFDYDQLNNIYDLFVPQWEKLPEQHYFPTTSKMSHTSSNNETSKETFHKQTTLVYTDLDEVTNLQCDYLETLEKCEHLEKELSKSRKMSKSFEALQKHAINLELDLQQCKEKIKNDKSFKENQSNVFMKEREQYLEIQDLKAQLQDKGIVISDLKKLIEKMKGISVNQLLFSDSLEKTDFLKSKSVTTQNVSRDFSKPVIAQILPQNVLPIFKNTNMIAPGMYKVHTKPNQTRTPRLPQDSRKTNKRVSFSTGVIPTTSVSRPQLKSNQLEDRVMTKNSQRKKKNVADHRRNFMFLNNKTSVTACNDSLNAKTLNVNFVGVTYGKCVLNDNHDLCVIHYINGVNSRTRQPIAVPISTREPKHNVNQSVATSSKKTVATDSTVKKSRNITRKLYEQLVEIILFIADSGCSKHMTQNLKLLTNFKEKFLGTVKFGNDQIAPILSYGDLGNDLLTGSHGTDLYSITLQDIPTSNPICLMTKTTLSQAWLWHRHLSHLNFDTINLLLKNNIVNGLPKLKFVKDHLCSSCELGKAKRKSFHTKTTPSSKRRLQLLHMDLCGPMQVESINEKKYVLVIVDDYSRYTWTHFLRSNDETPEVLIDFLTLIQRGLHAQVRTVQTDKGTEFLNKTLHTYFAKEGIKHETSTARTPEQNGVVERRNHTLVEAARTMLSATKIPLFFWSEAIATACFTQNRSLVIPRHEKTPYYIINARKPSVKFFHIFGSLCYIIRDGGNLDKMKEKGDACIFVGYSTQSRAFRVFNKRTRIIVKTIHVNFNELPQMVLDHVTETVTTSNELDLLFSLMFDELLNGTTPVVSKSFVVHAADAPNKRQQQHTTPSTSTTVVADTPLLNIQATPVTTSQAPTQVPTVTATENIIQAKTNNENA